MGNIIRLSFVGDFCTQHPEKIIVKSELQDMWNQCDFNILNFEGPLNVGKLHTANNTILPQSNYSPKWCVDNGFNIVSLANNHAYDYGEDGLKATVAAFKDKASTIGVGTWENAYSPSFVEVKGKKIGFLAFTSADLSSLKDKWTDKNRYGSAWVNYTKTNDIIRTTSKKCDFLFVIVHAGVEHMDVPLPEWRDRYRDIIDCGATAVIAAHPHCPQGWEEYRGKFILYSLGNFYFDWNKRPDYWDDGILAFFEIKDNAVSMQLHSTKRAGNVISMDDTKLPYLDNLHNKLINDDLYINEVEKQIMVFAKKYEGWLLNGLGAIKMDKSILRRLYRLIRYMFHYKLSFNYRSALHQLREESTRYTLIRAYKILSKTEL